MIRQVVAGYAYWPYCGAPPSPATLATRWNLDPLLLGALALVLLAYLALTAWGAPTGAFRTWRRIAFAGGWTVAALALTSPLCALSVSLFAARAAQHMILAILAAPLIALGWPLAPRRTVQPLVPAILFAAALWFWHAPGPYRATFQGEIPYWLMHLGILGSAVWLWIDLLEARQAPAGLAASAALTTVQMALLGAAITFAKSPLYAPHLTTTAAWGLTPMEDQQLGGLIMWAPSGLVFTIGLLLIFAGLLERSRARAPRTMASA
jgi:putative membrane protein